MLSLFRLARPRPLAMLSPTEPVGLLAGAGRFPLYFVEKARASGIPVVGVGFRGMADPILAERCDRFYWTRLTTLGRIVSCFRREGVRRWTMAGKVHKVQVFSPRGLVNLIPDWTTIRFWFWSRRGDNRDDTVLLAAIKEMERRGLFCESALTLCPELLVRAGTLTKRRPTPKEEEDIAFGWTMAKEMGRLDVGQSVMVHQCVVLAVEAIEGTDQAIRRAGELCYGRGFVVVKVAKPNQDMRFDVPTVGPDTIATIQKAGGRVLAIEAGKTILLDEAETIAQADRAGICIVAR